MTTTADTQRLSEKLASMSAAIAARSTGDGMTLTQDDLINTITWLSQRAAEARKLERMLERRLKAHDLPWRGEPGAVVETTPANGGAVVQFRPRAGARVVPINGGAA